MWLVEEQLEYALHKLGEFGVQRMSKGCRVQTKEQRGLGGRQAGGWMEVNQISGMGALQNL